MLVSVEDVEGAARRLSGYTLATPCFSARSLSAELGCDLVLKAELFQRTGSFKVRGALNTVLQTDPEARLRGFVSMSAGNHGAALAYAARDVGSTARIVMPTTASRSKITATEAYGGTVVLTDGDLLERMGLERDAEDLVAVHPFEDARIIAGAGTVGLEIREQVPDADVVVVPTGGGGLISGIAVALHGSTEVIGVEPQGADVMTRSLACGTPQRLVPNTIADGLAAPFVGELTLEHVQSLVSTMLQVDDLDIARAMRDLYQRAKLAVEPSAAAGLAAVRRHRERFAGRRVVVVVSGGNVDPARAAQLLVAT
jgi:threonine dehydratase